MLKLRINILALFLVFSGWNSTAQAEPGINTFPEAKRIQAMLEQPESQIDLSRNKLIIDKMIDPNIDIEASLKQIDNIAAKIRTMLGNSTSSKDKMLAIKKYLYEIGEWNNFRPYQYDFDDPLGTKISNKLLPNYIASRKGNCISMPFLLIVLGEKLGIDVTASTAPLHVLVKYTDDKTGATINLETTSGANPAREEWYRKQMPMTDEAIDNGLYLQKLTKKETVVVMTTVLVEHYSKNQEYEKAIAITNIQLEHYPIYYAAMLSKGSVSYRLLEKHYLQKYPQPNQIPANERGYFKYLANNNRYWFAKAESLGWREPGKDDESKYLDIVKRDANRAAH